MNHQVGRVCVDFRDELTRRIRAKVKFLNFKDIENLTRRQLKTNLPAIMGEKNPTSHLEPRKQGVREKASADD